MAKIFAERDARDYADRHEVVRVFVEKRESAPTEGEIIQSLRPRGAYRSLHLGRRRGATLWDAETDTCWLIAYGEFHADDDRDNVYNCPRNRHARAMPAPCPHHARETPTRCHRCPPLAPG